MAKLIKDAMTRGLITVRSGESVSDVIGVMEENRIRHVPVVDAANSIVGIVSRRDYSEAGDLKRLKVDVVMTAPVFSISESTPMLVGVNKMLEKKISSLIVTNSKDEPVGIVTTEDFLRMLAKMLG